MRLARTLSILLALGCVAGCGDTIQDQPIARSALEPLISVRSYPVYWLGASFHDLKITQAEHDPSGAFTLRYGDCAVGGQYTCVTPLSIVTSPDNSFVPGYSPARRKVALRGVRGMLAERGETIEIATGGVVVEVYANDAALALAAARTMTPINRLGAPGTPLPAALPDTGFAAEPLPFQEAAGGG